MRAETGPIGGDLSHEFIVLAETGEFGVFCNKDVLDLPIPGDDVDYDGDLTDIIKQWTSVYAATEDVHDAARFEHEVPADKRVTRAASRSARYSISAPNIPMPMKAWWPVPTASSVPIHGGSYGVGVSRLVGAIIEACHDDAGIKWPETVAPFRP